MNVAPRITFLGQSGFLLDYNDSRLLIDPSNKQSGDLEGNIVFCTHKHNDHIGGVDIFLERNPTAILLCDEETASKFDNWSNRVKIVHGGETFTHTPWTFHFTKLRHGILKNTFNLAAVITSGDFSFAHCGDAVEFDNFPNQPVDFLAIPISGGVTASPGKASKMIAALDGPKPIIVPMHWLVRNPKSFCKKLCEQIPDIRCIVPKQGETLEL